MKRTLLSVLLSTLLLCPVQTKAAPKNPPALPIKIGYANMEYVISFLPETKKIESEYRSFEAQLRSQLEAKVKELEEKLQALEQGYATMTEDVKNQKKAELQQLQGNFEQLQVEAKEKLAHKHTSLLAPIYEKVQQAIEKVAQEHDYTHVFNTGPGGMSTLLYASEEHDLSDKVLKKLGVDLSQDKGKEKKK